MFLKHQKKMKNKFFSKTIKSLILFTLTFNIPNFGKSYLPTFNERTFQKANLDLEYASQKITTEKIINISELRELIIKNNDKLKVIESQIEQSKKILNSKYAEWAPRLDLNSDQLPKYTMSDTRQASGNTTSNQLKVGANILFEWDIINPNRRLEIKIAKEKLENLNSVYNSTLNDLLFEAKEIYHSILSSKQEIKMAKQSIKTSTLTLNEIKNRYKNGFSNKLDFLEAKTQLNRDKIILLNKQDQLKLNQNRLYEILNIENEIQINDDEIAKISYVWIANNSESIIAAMNSNYDLKIKQKNIDINKNEALSLISNKKPTFTLYNNFSISSANGEVNVPDPNYGNLTKENTNVVGMKFRQNLFDGGKTKQKYLSILKRDIELKSDLNLSKNEIKKEIKNRLNQYNSIKENIILAKDQLEFTKESLIISLKRLEAGIGTPREVANLQGDVIESETNFINVLKAYKIIISDLTKLTNLKPNHICELNEKNINNSKFLNYLDENNLKTECKSKNQII